MESITLIDYELLKENDIHVGLATVVCVGFNKWKLPGGRLILDKDEATLAAGELHKLISHCK